MALLPDHERSMTDLLVRVLKAQEQQGERISRFLHDEAGPLLSTIGLQLDLLRMDLGEKSAEVSSRLVELQKLLEQAVVQVRDLSYELNPAVVERAGLQFALERLAAWYGKSFSGALRLGFDASVRLPAAAASAMYRIARLALDNAVEHAGCSQIEVLVKPAEGAAVLSRAVVENGPDKLKLIPQGSQHPPETEALRAATLEVIDNGRGFFVAQARDQARGLGLDLMRHHASQAGLQLWIASAPEKGTIVRACYRAPESQGP